MKIMLLCKRLSNGGIQAVFKRLHHEFEELGHEIKMVAMVSDSPVPIAIEENEINPATLGNSLISVLPRYRDIIREFRPNVVLSGHEQANILNVCGSRIIGGYSAVVSRHIAFSTGERSEGGWARKWFATKVYGSAHSVIAVSKGIRNELIQAGIPESKVHAIYNPTISRNFLKYASMPPEIEICTSGFIFTACGRLVPQKGFDVLLKAFSIVHKMQRSSLIIMGEGPEEANLKSIAIKLGVEVDVHFVGHVKNPNPYYAMSDCFVLSSRWEGFGLVLAEALACGTRVASTDCPHGPREILQDGKLGPLARVDDPESLARAMIDALAWKVRPSKHDMDIFRTDVSAKAYIDVFNSVIC